MKNATAQRGSSPKAPPLPPYTGTKKRGEKTIDVTSLGEAVVDMISTCPGSRVQDAPGFVKALGGAMENVTIGCSKLGAKAAFIGKVGDDPFGAFLKEGLRQAGCVTEGMVFSSTRNTSLVFVNLDRHSKPSFYFFGKPAADLDLKRQEVKVRLIEMARIFHFGTISLSGEPSRGATLFAVKTARRGGALVSFDPNLRFHRWDNREHAIEWALKMVPMADLIKVNQDEARWLTGTGKASLAAERLLALGPRLAVVTLGEKGSCFATPGAVGRLPGFRARVVDTTGAGDAFVAAMLTELATSSLADPLADLELIQRALLRATAAATLTTEAMGAVSAMPDRVALERALRTRFNK